MRCKLRLFPPRPRGSGASTVLARLHDVPRAGPRTASYSLLSTPPACQTAYLKDGAVSESPQAWPGVRKTRAPYLQPLTAEIARTPDWWTYIGPARRRRDIISRGIQERVNEPRQCLRAARVVHAGNTCGDTHTWRDSSRVRATLF